MPYVYTDLNTRLDTVNPNDIMVIHDAQAIKQSLYRLLYTEVGEIPFYRNYGLDLKQFVQKPLTPETAQSIFNYVESRISAFEPRAEVINAVTDVDWMNSSVIMEYTFRVRTTGEIFSIAPFVVPVGV